MRTTTASVAAVVLHWGEPRLTRDLLSSLDRCGYSELTVFLVDQGADVVFDLRERDVLVHTEENLGFCVGNNRAIAEALRREFDFILLINNDTVVEPGALALLVRSLESNERAAAASPTVLFEDPAGVIWYGGGAYDEKRARSSHVGKHEPFVADADAAAEKTSFIPWCAIIVRAEALRDIGPLDERFFMYWEDTEWCVRALSSGHDLLYVPSSVVIHRIGVEREINSPQRLYYFFRNWLLFMRLHTPRRWRIRAWVGFADRFSRELVKVFTRYTVNRADYVRMLTRALLDYAGGRFGKFGG